MAFYRVLFRKTYGRYMQYRMSGLLNNLGSLIFGFMYIAIWQGTLGPGQEVVGFGREEMGQYIGFTQTMFMITMILPRGFGIEQGVRTGAVSMELMRPISFFGFHLAQAFAIQAYSFLIRSTMMWVCFAWAVGVPDFEWWTAVLLPLSMLIAAYTAFLMNYFVGMAAFWTGNTRWAFIVWYTLVTTFSGFFVPLPILPGAEAWGVYNPFAGMHYYPAMVYLGQPSVTGFVVPLFWAAVLTGVALWVTARARRKMEVQGG